MFRHFNINMKLCLIENYKDMFPEAKGRELTDRLIAFVLEELEIRGFELKRSEKGKPYLASLREDLQEESPEKGDSYKQVHLSVSHSGELFACLIDEENTGVDIQQYRNVEQIKIARRYFDDREIEYVKKHGSAGFFKLWTRKEAYCKYTGRGLEEIMRGTQVLEREDVEFIDFQLGGGIYCSCCVKRR